MNHGIQWIAGFLLLSLPVLALEDVLPSTPDWKPAYSPLTTPWTDKVDPKAPWPEYPRPQFVRDRWTNLNGLWDYAITPKDAPAPAKFDGKILVPYPIESALSGLRINIQPTQQLWYSRSFAAP